MAEEAKRIPLPWSRSCFVCGESNPRGLRARSWLVGEFIELPFETDPELVGWLDVIHGGIIATILDEVMTWAAIVRRERPCFAAEFSVRLRRPLPPRTRCVARARVSGERRQIADTEAELRDEAGLLYASATGRYMSMPETNQLAAHHDFVTAPGCWPVEKILKSEPTREES